MLSKEMNILGGGNETVIASILATITIDNNVHSNMDDYGYAELGRKNPLSTNWIKIGNLNPNILANYRIYYLFSSIFTLTSQDQISFVSNDILPFSGIRITRLDIAKQNVLINPKITYTSDPSDIILCSYFLDLYEDIEPNYGADKCLFQYGEIGKTVELLIEALA